jgi:hypothetical protein
VSPWSRETIEARWSPHAVALRRSSRGRELNRYRYEVDAVEDACDWRPAFAVLKSKIESLAWRKADLHVVLPGQWTKLVLMPWTANVSEQDALAYARHQFHSIYDVAADAWEICLGVAQPRRPRVAAAVERALIDELKALAAARDLRLRSLRPLLSTLVDALPPKHQALSGWVALIEPGYLQIAGLDAGYCIDLRGARYAADPLPALLSLLQQSALSTDRDTDSAPLALYAADAPDCGLLQRHGWRVATATPDFA